MASEDRYVFHVEWFDQQADVIRRYMLTYFVRDNSIAMYDPKNKREFLKRCPYEDISLKKLYIGSVVTVHARQLKVIDYADDWTRNALEARKSRTLALIKPDAYNQVGTVFSAVCAAGFVVARVKMVRMTPDRAAAFCGMQSSEESGPAHQEHLQTDVCIALELVGDDAVSKWKAIAGPFDPRAAKSQAPRSLRAQFGKDVVRNVVHASESIQHAEEEIGFFFGQPWPTTALFMNCTCVIVRPHAFHYSGEIITAILASGFEISAMGIWYMNRAMAEEFLEVYRNVVPNFHDSAAQLCTGPCLVMEVRQDDAVQKMRALAGPADPEMAKHLRPHSLRAKYGVDPTLNAVHCTDLPDDGLLEVEYFFQIQYEEMN